MTAMQLVDSHRDHPTIWLARGAPRRWYAQSTQEKVKDEVKGEEEAKVKDGAKVQGEEEGKPNLESTSVLFGVTSAPSRWGTVGYAVHAQDQSSGNTTVTLTVAFPHPPGAAANTPTLMVRVRDPTGTKQLVWATTTSPDCEISRVDGPDEVVEARPTPRAVNKQKIDQCVIVVSFK